MDLFEDLEFRVYFLFLLSLYIGLGLFGVLWISDEFDYERSIIFGFLGIPAVILLFTLVSFKENWWVETVKQFWSLVGVIIICFSWGVFLVLNAISSDNTAVVNLTVKEEKLSVAHKRGGFDWLYKQRW